MKNKEKKKVLYHSSYYYNYNNRILNIENKNKLVNDDSENPFEYCTSKIFLIGACDIFSLSLYDIFKYKIYKFISKKNKLHYFCMMNFQGNDFYIDIRGYTNSKIEFFNNTYEDGVIEKISKSEIKEIKQQKYFADGFNFAKSIINQNQKIYNINNSFLK